MLTCVFACTLSKTLEPSRGLHARRYRGLKPTEAIERWSAAISAATETTSVARLYKGGYWATARSLVQDTPLPMQALVASAGVGLRGFNERIPAYAATFNSGELDSIPGGHSLTGLYWWWRHTRGRPRLRALAEGSNPKIAVALPGQYLKVVLPDLLFLQRELGPRALTVFTTDRQAIDELGACAVELDRRMSAVLGGTVGQLTVRALDHVVRKAEGLEDITPGRARSYLQEVRLASPERLFPKRIRQTEEQAAAWIRGAKSSDAPPASASAALRRFRDAGFAFEQKRFGRLFRSLDQES